MSDYLKIAEDNADEWDSELVLEIEQTIAQLMVMIEQAGDPDVRDILDDAVSQLAGLLEIESEESEIDDRLDAA